MIRSHHDCRYGRQVAVERFDEIDAAALAAIEEATARTGQPWALDLGCGVGAMSVAFARAGARVVAVDRENYEEEVATRRIEAGLAEDSVQFHHAVAPECLDRLSDKWDVVYAQRMLHYLTYSDARETLLKLRRNTRLTGGLFIGVSGLGSELSTNYPDAASPVHVRFSKLAQDIQERHLIREPVCLYAPHELVQLVTDCGFRTLRVWQSDFGNIKLQAFIGG